MELGVQTPDGRVRSQRRAKFRQVNRFVELVDDIVPRLPEGRLRIVDFGSGRAYLTFALHDLLVRRHGRQVELLGLDVKPDVVADCEALARRLDAAGLSFEVGDIAEADLDDVDLVVSLHACDTATDAALDRAVRGGARVILAVPCCQHELLGQLDNDVLRPLLRHGTLRERFVAEVTDAARARLLELAGYDVQVVEFVALEHTPKNVLLRAVRTVASRARSSPARARVPRVRGLARHPSRAGAAPRRPRPGVSRAASAGVLPEAHEVALAVLEVRGDAHVPDRDRLADGGPAARRGPARACRRCRRPAIVITGRLTSSPRCVMPPPTYPGSLGIP